MLFRLKNQNLMCFGSAMNILIWVPPKNGRHIGFMLIRWPIYITVNFLKLILIESFSKMSYKQKRDFLVHYWRSYYHLSVKKGGNRIFPFPWKRPIFVMRYIDARLTTIIFQCPTPPSSRKNRLWLVLRWGGVAPIYKPLLRFVY